MLPGISGVIVLEEIAWWARSPMGAAFTSRGCSEYVGGAGFGLVWIEIICFGIPVLSPLCFGRIVIAGSSLLPYV